jgi:lysophospholipid acyltransferase (LPLAT)-like uncharacterized protein
VSDATYKQQLIGQGLALALPQLLNLFHFRIFHFDRSVDPARPEYNEHVIFAFWHEYIGVVLPRWGHTPLTVLCSHHRDGELVNQTALSLGLHIVRGSSNRGGSSAIRQLKKNSKFSSIAITPDGPRGPRREMAMGPIYLASLLKIPVVPVGVGIDHPRRLNTWDRFAIPRPFSRVRMVFGPKIHIPSRLERDELEARRLGVETLMNDLSDQAETWATSGKKLSGEQAFLRVRRSNQKRFDQPARPRWAESNSKSPRAEKVA